jgi:dihydroorotate dehydrogenase
MYRLLLRPLLFKMDPERAHHLTFRLLRLQLMMPLGGFWLRLMYAKKDSRLEREIFGLKFPNPVGLAAGFDKDALLHEGWRNLGFGFAEMGTVTPRPQAGNPKPRLFRLPADKGIINRMGFNNGGLSAMVERLQRRKGKLIIGGNIGKNKDTPNEQATDDYVKCFDALYPHVDYFVVNVSSPNTPNLRELQEKEPLRQLLQTLQDLNQSKPKAKPLLLKIAPDLTDGQLDDVIEIAAQTRLSGIVATNTTISRAGLTTPEGEVTAIGAGGLSGAPLTQRSTEVVKYIHQKTAGKLPIIAAGGIMSPQDAQQKLAAGASLVQVYTGFVYGGPGFVRRILAAFAAK